MDKLVEREPGDRAPLASAPAVAVQFFLIPLIVVGAMVLIYMGFRSLVTDERSAAEYLIDIRNGGTDHRWPAAYELSRLMSDPEVVKREQATLGPELVKAFEASKGDDPRVRRYLALALGRLPAPIPPDARRVLVDALNDPDSETRISAIWALGSTGDATAVPALRPMYGSEDAGVRKMTVYALGALPGDEGNETLIAALQDSVPDVQWNAAIALARHGRREGVPVLKRMLDREYVERTVSRQPRAQDEVDPVGEVMISGLRAVAALRESTLSEPVTALSRDDQNLKVRQAALETLKAMS